MLGSSSKRVIDGQDKMSICLIELMAGVIGEADLYLVSQVNSIIYFSLGCDLIDLMRSE